MEHLTDVAPAASPSKRFRWQIIPATIQIVFGGIGLLAAVLLPWEICYRHELSKSMEESNWVGTALEKYAAPDTPYWSVHVFIGEGSASALVLVGAYYWLRRRNKAALALTAAALAFHSATHWWVSSRFPDL
jgi:hypothetical protein